MHHYIAYHNARKMGRPLLDDEPLRLLTRKPVRPLLDNTVWLITGEGTSPRRYALGSVFLVTEVGDTAEDGFTHYASGPGHVFRPPVPVTDTPWFPEVIRATGHFGFGVQQVKHEAVIASLLQLASQAGYQVV